LAKLALAPLDLSPHLAGQALVFTSTVLKAAFFVLEFVVGHGANRYSACCFDDRTKKDVVYAIS